MYKGERYHQKRYENIIMILFALKLIKIQNVPLDLLKDNFFFFLSQRENTSYPGSVVSWWTGGHRWGSDWIWIQYLNKRNMPLIPVKYALVMVLKDSYSLIGFQRWILQTTGNLIQYLCRLPYGQRFGGWGFWGFNCRVGFGCLGAFFHPMQW